MAETKIALLTISPSIDGTDYLIVDNTEVTRRTTINSLSSVAAKWSLPTSTVVQANSASWNNTYTTVQTLSAYVETKVAEVSRVSLSSVNTNFNFIDLQSGVLTSYSNTHNITAYIGPAINTPNFVTTVAQLSSGTITLKLPSSYTGGSLISYGDLYETAGVGATANIVRVSDNKFLITGLLQ